MNKFLSVLAALTLCGCGTIKNGYVVTTTGTVIGLQVAQNQVSQMYEGKLGYVRSEVALIPTNGPPVMMEMNFSGIFSFNGGIYQRLAIGQAAVSQPGAAFMFAKSPNGTLDAGTAAAVSGAVQGIKPATDTPTTAALLPLAQAYAASTNKAGFDAVAVQSGYTSFSAFLTDKSVTLTKVQAVYELLKTQHVMP